MTTTTWRPFPSSVRTHRFARRDGWLTRDAGHSVNSLPQDEMEADHVVDGVLRSCAVSAPPQSVPSPPQAQQTQQHSALHEDRAAAGARSDEGDGDGWGTESTDDMLAALGEQATRQQDDPAAVRATLLGDCACAVVHRATGG
jgi:hypothetical protein